MVESIKDGESKGDAAEDEGFGEAVGLRIAHITPNAQKKNRYSVAEGSAGVLGSMIEKPDQRMISRLKFCLDNDMTEELKESSRESDSIFVPIMVEEP